MLPSLSHRILRVIGHQHWIPRGRDRMLRTFCAPEKTGDVPFTVDFFGARYRGNLNNFLDWAVYFYGAYSSNELFLLRDVARAMRETRQAVVFLDIGANVGQHTLYMASSADRIVAFEPLGAVRSKLEEKIRDNHLRNVTVLPFGLGEVDGELEYFEPGGPNMGTGTFVGQAPGNWSGRKQILKVRRGDPVLFENKIERVDIMKIDVEGFEPSVLRGLRACLDRDRPVILMELSDAGRRTFESEHALRECLYPDHLIMGVGTSKITNSYKLRTFDFAKDGEIIVLPPEFSFYAVNRS